MLNMKMTCSCMTIEVVSIKTKVFLMKMIVLLNNIYDFSKKHEIVLSNWKRFLFFIINIISSLNTRIYFLKDMKLEAVHIKSKAFQINMKAFLIKNASFLFRMPAYQQVFLWTWLVLLITEIICVWLKVTKQ